MNPNICIAMLAHVDAGKTTLSECILSLSGVIRKMGRVDHKDTFLDTHELERKRGITIFSKQALFSLGDQRFTLLDTPGHVDFSAEMERTLQVLDYAVLIISGADGVQGHTQTLWKLLKRYQVPVFLFVNKMDQDQADGETLLKELKEKLDDRCVDFGCGVTTEAFLEELAMCDEEVLEKYLENGEVRKEDIIRLVAGRKVFPCYFGSALREKGVDTFLEGVKAYAKPPVYKDIFGAKIFKVSRDTQGNRLTWLKVTGGVLKVKALLSGGKGEDAWEEKVNQIRLYSGEKYETVDEAEAGCICAVTGLTRSYAGEGLGAAKDTGLPLLEPVLTYRIELPLGCDPMQMLGKLKSLEEELPELHVRWDARLGELQVQLMGEVQTEVLKALVKERFDVLVSFGEGRIVYKETIAGSVEGVGHFEPLRHYAEVHLLLEPGEPGSGLTFSSSCSEDLLSRNWQRLILTHLEEKAHLGVLTGSEITDMQITLVSGKAHIKHTEGGDFRQATYRAVRQGLMQAQSILLEPCYEFRLEIPSGAVGRAMADLDKMHASFNVPVPEGDRSVLTGTAPVATMQNYHQEVASYTRGEGRLFASLKGYAPCHNTQEVLGRVLYDPEADTDNPPDSVFCYHGAGMIVPWYEVKNHMHLESIIEDAREKDSSPPKQGRVKLSAPPPGTFQEEKELEEIFIRTYGQPKERTKDAHTRRQVYGGSPEAKSRPYKPKEKVPEYLLVDGYNIIFAWEELSGLAKENIDSARDRLMDVMCNYQGYKKCSLILVFDAYRVEGHIEEIIKYHNIHVVYTREAETADQYIERTAHEIGRKYHVVVATSDGLEQIIIRGQGCTTMSARELKEEVERMNQEIRENYMENVPGNKNYLFDALPEGLAEHLKEVRLGKRDLE